MSVEHDARQAMHSALAGPDPLLAATAARLLALLGDQHSVPALMDYCDQGAEVRDDASSGKPGTDSLRTS
jgi:hypothetical protein